MPIPDYQTLMLPLLEFTGDGKEHPLSEAREALADKLRITNEERNQLIKSGQPLWNSRVHWARTYLLKAGLLESSRQGIIRITQRGLDALAQKPARIDNKFLGQFPEFVEFSKRDRESASPTTANGEDRQVESQTQTPDDLIDTAYKRIRATLAQELLDKIKASRPAFFEVLVVKLLLKMGYGGSRDEAGTVTSLSRDGGIDGIINEERLGLDAIYIQAKKWEDTKISRPELQKFVGALQQHKAKKGVFITTSSFTPDAHSYVNQIETKLALIDGEKLAQLMIDHNVGVSTSSTIEIKRIDSDFFVDN